MHACVAALSSGVPTVGIGYVGKFSGQFSWYGDLGTVLEYRDGLDAAEVVDAAQQLETTQDGAATVSDTAYAADASGGAAAVTAKIRNDYAELGTLPRAVSRA